jgi:enterochelin esterase-like enzyme
MSDDVIFTYREGRRRPQRVRLVHALGRPREHDFERRGHGEWELRLPRPPVDRLEYQLELTGRTGHTELVLDPANPLRAAGPFGDKSVLEFPEYRPPAWVAERASAGTVREKAFASRVLRRDLPVVLWTPRGVDPDADLPLLVAHDGPEYARFSGLTDFLALATAAGRIPPLRAALLQPVDRDEIYSASAAYTRALTRELLPSLRTDRSTLPVGLGASLGALALLHAHRALPASFDGLLLQSGSFFRQRSDRQESGYPRFRRISRFVGEVLGAEAWDDLIPVVVTCGTGEENLDNNRAVARALAAQGYDVHMAELRDAHTWVCWRDALDPHLPDLVRKAWG